jgi:hypothetical protein
VPDPPHQAVVSLGKGLFDPLHNSRKLHPVFGLDIESEPIILKAQGAHCEYELKFRLLEHLTKERQGPGMAEQRLPIVDAGADLIPHPLF